MAVNFLVPLLIPLGEQITNVSELHGSGTLTFAHPDQTVIVPENTAPAVLTVLTATSNTTHSPVFYEVVGGEDVWMFHVHSHSGKLVLSKPLDYEHRNTLDVFVGAHAGTEKTYGRVVVNVTDVNDNAPTFPRPLYETQVTEEDDRHLPRKILQVTAYDVDSTDKESLVYSIRVGEADAEFISNAASVGIPINVHWNLNTNSSVDLKTLVNEKPDIPFNETMTEFFEINPRTGDITFTKPLDRDAPVGRPHWFLWVGAWDGLHQATARLLVNVKDVNDNAPFFQDEVATGSVRENAKAGEEVTTVKATDYDDPSETGHATVSYAIEKNVIDEASGKPIFNIHPHTGKITTAMCCLDREKTASYNVQVVATDGGGLKGTGTVLVLVEDENDVLPSFSSPHWQVEVEEGAPPGTVIALLTVEDDDVTNEFSYRIVPNSGYGWDKFALRVQRVSAQYDAARSRMPNVEETALEISSTRNIFSKVKHSKLLKSLKNKKTDKVESKNDQTVSVTGQSNFTSTSPKLISTSESLFGKSNNKTSKFKSSKRKNGAELITFEKLNYENVTQRRGFRFIIQVTDKPINWSSVSTILPPYIFGVAEMNYNLPNQSQMPTFSLFTSYPRVSTSWVEVTVLDSNDNPPQLSRHEDRVTLPEDTPVDTLLAVFPATDVDTADNGRIHYSIFQESDPHHLFLAESNGEIILHNLLDRETQDKHDLKVLVSDLGTPSHTVTASLEVTVTDVNDNPPYIVRVVPADTTEEDGRGNTENNDDSAKKPIIIKENSRPRTLATVLLDDPDDWSLGHGPPFLMVIDPAAPAKTRRSFGVEYKIGGDRGRGVGVVSSLIPLDRETGGPNRYLPLLLTDAGGKSSTVTLTVVVTDVNDNPMQPAEKEVFVVRIAGSHDLTPVGRVFVRDPDDWDASLKTWKWRGAQNPFFVLDEGTGDMAMQATAPDGRYTLHFSVSDPQHDQSDVQANVSVLVTSHDVVQPSVVLTVAHQTPESLVRKANPLSPSLLDRLLQAIRVVTGSVAHLVSMEATVPEILYLHGLVTHDITSEKSVFDSVSAKNKSWLFRTSELLSRSFVLKQGTHALKIRQAEISENITPRKTGARIWLSGRGNHSFDQMLLFNIDKPSATSSPRAHPQIAEASGLRLFSVGLGICGHVPHHSSPLPLTHPDYEGRQSDSLQEKLRKVENRFWVVDANSTAVVTPRITLSLDCDCAEHDDTAGEHTTHRGWVEQRLDDEDWNNVDSRKAKNTPSDILRRLSVQGRDIDTGREKESAPKDEETLFTNVHYRELPQSLSSSTGVDTSMKRCYLGLCLNGGKCIENIESAVCVCPEGTSKPFCKHLSAHFTRKSTASQDNDTGTKNGWVWLGTARLCTPAHISFEFRTHDADGTLLYAGPRPKDKGGGTTKYDTFDANPKVYRSFLANSQRNYSYLIKNFTLKGSVERLPRLEKIGSRHHHQDLLQNQIQEPVLSLELKNGRPQLLFSFDLRLLKLSYQHPINDGKFINLSDGIWHRIDFIWTNENIELVIDLCRNQESHCHMKKHIGNASDFINLSNKQHTQQRKQNFYGYSFSEALNNVSQSNNFTEQKADILQNKESQFRHQNIFNPETPFQVGGLAHLTPSGKVYMWPSDVVHGISFQGCIRNIRINNQLQDLGPGRLSQDVSMGCPLTDPCHARPCPLHASCSSSPPSCHCLPGHRGPLCRDLSTPATVTRDSYAKLALSFKPPVGRVQIQLRLRTRSTVGQILLLTSLHRKNQLKLHLSSGKVCLSLTLTKGSTSSGARGKRSHAVPAIVSEALKELGNTLAKLIQEKNISDNVRQSDELLQETKQLRRAKSSIRCHQMLKRRKKYIAPPTELIRGKSRKYIKQVKYKPACNDSQKIISGSLNNIGDFLSTEYLTYPLKTRYSTYSKHYPNSVSNLSRKIRNIEGNGMSDEENNLQYISRDLCLTSADLNDGEWHTIHAKSYGQFLELWADEGDHPNYNSSLTQPIFAPSVSNHSSNFAASHNITHNNLFTPHNFSTTGEKESSGALTQALNAFDQSLLDSDDILTNEPLWGSFPFTVDQQEGVHIGGMPEFIDGQLVSVSGGLEKSCIDDLRLWDHPLPLPSMANATQAAQLTSYANIEAGCRTEDACENVTCSGALECIDTWQRHLCSCGAGRRRVALDRCEDMNECRLWQPCLLGQCVNEAPGYTCHCPATHGGKNCEISISPKAVFNLSAGAVLATVTSFVIIFVFVFGIIYLVRLRKRLILKKKHHLSEPSSASSSPYTHRTFNSNPSNNSAQCSSPPFASVHQTHSSLPKSSVTHKTQSPCGSNMVGQDVLSQVKTHNEEMENNISDFDILKINFSKLTRDPYKEKEFINIEYSAADINNRHENVSFVKKSENGSLGAIQKLKTLTKRQENLEKRGGVMTYSPCEGCSTVCEANCNIVSNKTNAGSACCPTQDDLRDYAYEGEGSTPGSLSSCCSGPDHIGLHNNDLKLLGGFQEVASLLRCLSSSEEIKDRPNSNETKFKCQSDALQTHSATDKKLLESMAISSFTELKMLNRSDRTSPRRNMRHIKEKRIQSIYHKKSYSNVRHGSLPLPFSLLHSAQQSDTYLDNPSMHADIDFKNAENTN